MAKYKTLLGDPAHGAVPPGEYNVLETLMTEWESMVGYAMEPPTWMLLEMANGGVQTIADFGKYMADVQVRVPGVKAYINTDTVPWANYGLTKDQYVSAASILGTTYKEVTGSDISPEALAQAFTSQSAVVGGLSGALLTGGQYKQQLMNDAAVQKQFGWVKYGMDFSAWTQQKLSMRTAYGRDINDAEASTLLQYHKASTGANMGAVARASGQQSKESPAGVGQSVAR